METSIRMKMRNDFLNVYRICLRDAEDGISHSAEAVGDKELSFSTIKYANGRARIEIVCLCNFDF